VASALALGRDDHARKGLDGAPWSGTEPRPTVERLVLWAWLASNVGAFDELRTRLAEAMDIAERHSLVEAFVRGGPAVIGMVTEYGDAWPAFRESILRRGREVRSPLSGGELADPLTDRELEILSFLPSRLTNTELAGQCYVSVNTIKTHMAHIYRKLDAANRNEAIVRARELGLL
jgi:LuxR family maltose regulon positive regulatory protein